MVDRSWMDASRFNANHLAGIERFLSFAIEKSLFNRKIYCPFHRCNNRILHESHLVGEHLRLHGIIKEYKYWIFHGESIERTLVQTSQMVRTSPSISMLSQDNEANLRDLITDALAINIPTLHESFDGVSSEFQNNGREYDANEAQKTTKRATTLLDDCDIPLYPSCVKFSCVSFLLRLYHFKVLFEWLVKSLICLLEFLNEAFRDGNIILTTYYEAKRKIFALNLGYVKIDACPNDCMLYWGDANEQLDGSCRCPKPTKLTLIFRGEVQEVKLLAQYVLKKLNLDGYDMVESSVIWVFVNGYWLNTHFKNSHKFDGTIEYGVAPIPQSREDILREVEGINFIYGKAQKRDREELDERLVELNVDKGCDFFNDFEELVVEGDEANLINQDKTLREHIFFTYLIGVTIYFDITWMS
ncbi:hypothetical protein J1N35_043981 [Gossypium stocksii]|uniref:Transposase-associated domain-containing protein n=1 Tax=Gossypium stocksii TaxID=47602 RepID=A0A9D3ZFG1_9ROSI|nr:hypothetical protein J1N35_043981 [Gossypium stocksii]